MIKKLGGEKEEMKTKNKTLALVEIVVVLCSLFLVTILPATAIEQSQEMQKVGASEATTASKDDFVLGVYGNANEDDTIDMRDLTYVKLIFFGKKPETELADAKYDGKINPLDFIQIKLIIVGKEKELTVVQYLGTPPDITEEPITIDMPIERIVTVSTYACMALCALNAADKIVGVSKYTKDVGEIAEFIRDKEDIGYIDVEKVISLRPNIIITYTSFFKYYPQYKNPLISAGIPVLLTDISRPEKYEREIKVLGWLLGKQERAEELVNFEKRVYGIIDDRVSKIPESEKPNVGYTVVCPCPYPIVPLGTASMHSKDTLPFIYWGGSGTANHNEIIRCGGINAFGDIKGFKELDPEEVIKRDPDVIILQAYTGYAGAICGYNAENSDSLREVRNIAMNLTGWNYITAVKNGDIYILCVVDAGGIHPCIRSAYIAKWLHPDRFKDLDPIKIHADWLNEFLGIPYKGVYAYPTPWTET